MASNLYVHFPFCRRKCSYCALHSRAGVSAERRREYVDGLLRALGTGDLGQETWRTIYFGGGSPALCGLRPLLSSLIARSSSLDSEFTVELHPLDVTDDLLKTLRDGGVNRISMGVQSLDDAVLADMGRGYTFDEAERAFAMVRSVFDNAGIDLIVGYPGAAPSPRLGRLANWGIRHCSVYTLIPEEKTQLVRRIAEGKATLPSDDESLAQLDEVARFLGELGLERYEISNFAVPGFECRHNLAVWRGENYIGLGEGAHGRLGLTRTRNFGTPLQVVETVSPETDGKERRLFRLRTREGLETAGHPEWRKPLDAFVAQGLLARDGSVCRLTPRGTEVCDAILTELV